MIWRFVDLLIFIETSPQPPSKGEPIHEHYTSNMLIDKLAHWQIDSLANRQIDKLTH